ncbi:MAG: PLP-dependent aminotransferase family protein [Candidatus Zixiibacteriota bacterium]|nr:MAG: PLP-dependent aminotransferase family protein [candidate division Zixibacteria bacterium]
MLVGQNEKVQTEQWKIATHVVELESSIIREILKISSQPGVISFAGGLPAPELFPMEELREAMEIVVTKHGAPAFQYTLSRGIPQLRELLAERATAYDTATSVDNILITAGAQQAIELVARAFIDRGDYIITEYPTYVGALQAFNYYQAKYATVEMDAEGMIPERAEEKILKYEPKLIYTVSNFQNPTGITMSENRRVKLIELAARHNIPIIDDNSYGDIRFAGQPVPSLKSLGGDRVIALRSFSKIIAPGLRLGWMNGPESIMGYFERVKQCTDLHTNTLCQYLIYEFISAGKLEAHIARIIKDYRAKRDLMVQTMRDNFPEGIRWTEPEGGLFLWVELPEHMSAKELLPKAVAMKVAYVYGEPFFPDGQGQNTLRLNFSNATHDNIVEGITRLAELLKENM